MGIDEVRVDEESILLIYMDSKYENYTDLYYS